MGTSDDSAPWAMVQLLLAKTKVLWDLELRRAPIVTLPEKSGGDGLSAALQDPKYQVMDPMRRAVRLWTANVAVCVQMVSQFALSREKPASLQADTVQKELLSLQEAEVLLVAEQAIEAMVQRRYDFLHTALVAVQPVADRALRDLNNDLPVQQIADDFLGSFRKACSRIQSAVDGLEPVFAQQSGIWGKESNAKMLARSGAPRDWLDMPSAFHSELLFAKDACPFAIEAFENQESLLVSVLEEVRKKAKKTKGEASSQQIMKSALWALLKRVLFSSSKNKMHSDTVMKAFVTLMRHPDAHNAAESAAVSAYQISAETLQMRRKFHHIVAEITEDPTGVQRRASTALQQHATVHDCEIFTKIGFKMCDEGCQECPWPCGCLKYFFGLLQMVICGILGGFFLTICCLGSLCDEGTFGCRTNICKECMNEQLLTTKDVSSLELSGEARPISAMEMPNFQSRQSLVCSPIVNWDATCREVPAGAAILCGVLVAVALGMWVWRRGPRGDPELINNAHMDDKSTSPRRSGAATANGEDTREARSETRDSVEDVALEDPASGQEGVFDVLAVFAAAGEQQVGGEEGETEEPRQHR